MAYKIFIDGKEGTTGLQIFERFQKRTDIELLELSDNERKNSEKRRDAINAADFVFLCLPDEAAREAVSLCENEHTRIIDASTAHRTAKGWAYGFPELLHDFRAAIKNASRVAVPGCYASGFAAICFPLVNHKILPPDYPVVCHAVSGYSGAGKKGIAQYEGENRSCELESPRLYALTQEHKHLPEMQKICGLTFAPIFNPYICNYFSGMTVTISLHTRLLAKKMLMQNIYDLFCTHYANEKFVSVAPFMGDGLLTEPFIAANILAGTNQMRIFVYGNDERVVITSQFDNLGKGASGAAVQCLNIMMGIDEATGLN